MTTYFNVVPSNAYAPSFSPILDGESYICKLIWNISAQRYYLLCTDFNNNLQFFVPTVASMPGIKLESLIWSNEQKTVTGTCISPHNIPIGTICIRTIMGAQPDPFNGIQRVLSIDPYTFTYIYINNPSPDTLTFGQPVVATVSGSLNHLISMSAGYFNSTIVYRNNQFEVSP